MIFVHIKEKGRSGVVLHDVYIPEHIDESSLTDYVKDWCDRNGESNHATYDWEVVTDPARISYLIELELAAINHALHEAHAAKSKLLNIKYYQYNEINKF